MSYHNRFLHAFQAVQNEAIYLYRGNVLRPHSDEKENRWLESRKQAQLQTLDRFRVFHDFQFSDQISESRITFKNAVVDDAAKQYKSIHYDHGNGVAAADVDGDGRIDLYFVTQLGTNELWRNLGNGQFENITEAAGVGLGDRISVTASFADIDNDGDQDYSSRR